MQAYRLYTLALSGSADIGAMNRLREQQNLQTAEQWRLAAGYHLAGQSSIAAEIAKGLTTGVPKYRELSNTYGSDIRDEAMILEALALMNMTDRIAPLVKLISKALSDSTYVQSTQTTAYALVALAKSSGLAGISGDIACSFVWNNTRKDRLTSNKPFVQVPLETGEGTEGAIEVVNNGSAMIYPRLICTGVPEMGSEQEGSNGLTLSVTYAQLNGDAIEDLSAIEQGTDIVATLEVSNTGNRGTYKEVALTHLVPSGFEIHNGRFASGEEAPAAVDYQDIRDDRVYTYFDIQQDETKRFSVLLNASYCGRFYLPMISVEAMYDPTINARTAGQWIDIVEPGK
jgi:hypothetical protein